MSIIEYIVYNNNKRKQCEIAGVLSKTEIMQRNFLYVPQKYVNRKWILFMFQLFQGAQWSELINFRLKVITVLANWTWIYWTLMKH